MINGTAILAGQLLGTAFACGLNLYATVAVLGIAARFELLAGLPPGMRGLENGVVILSAVALFLIEFVADRVRYVDNAWEAVHTLIRPAAAGLLAALALQDAPATIQFAGAAAAAVMALVAHGSKAGVRLILNVRRARGSWARTLFSLTEDVAAIGIAITALLYPTAAGAFVAAAVVLLLAFAGPQLWRAAMLGLFAVRARLRGFFRGAGWRTREQLPRIVRDVVPVEPVGRSPARAIGAAVTGLPRVGSYRNGWLVFTCDGPRFVYRSVFGARSAPIPSAHAVQLRAGVLTDALDVRADGDRLSFTLFLLKDGPPPHIAAAELTSLHA